MSVPTDASTALAASHLPVQTQITLGGKVIASKLVLLPPRDHFLT